MSLVRLPAHFGLNPAENISGVTVWRGRKKADEALDRFYRCRHLEIVTQLQALTRFSVLINSLGPILFSRHNKRIVLIGSQAFGFGEPQFLAHKVGAEHE
jgi:hypothetical protein